MAAEAAERDRLVGLMAGGAGERREADGAGRPAEHEREAVGK
jgi:hypothetical protein